MAAGLGMAAGLRNGLERLASGFAVCGLQVHTELADPGQLPVDAEEALYRVAQEAPSNAARHSGADAAQVWLVTRQSGETREEWVEMTVTDRGKGFRDDETGPPGPEGGFGLWVMRERMAGAGGSLEVSARPGQGTVITAHVHAGRKEDERGPPGGQCDHSRAGRHCAYSSGLAIRQGDSCGDGGVGGPLPAHLRGQGRVRPARRNAGHPASRP